MINIVPSDLLPFLQTHGYWILFFIMVVEGPIISYVAAFAASLGIFNVYSIFLLSFLGNVVGDAILFAIGHIGRKLAVHEYVAKLISKKRIQKIEHFIKNHPGKALTIIKLTPSLPVPGLLISGAMGVKVKTFLFYSILLSLVYAVLFTTLGFYAGSAFYYLYVYVKYSGFIIGAAVVSTVIVWFMFRLISKQIAKIMNKI